jgi:hypothetical protein
VATSSLIYTIMVLSVVASLLAASISYVAVASISNNNKNKNNWDMCLNLTQIGRWSPSFCSIFLPCILMDGESQIYD